ncbi:TIGR00730 family Rossman fold protein [Paenibacillus sp. GCM10027626]|uniref:LOG family protein n=1 Tax=Paenibacillus sp. GCM10027626 TaxID=3273411 RepID=UPI00363164C3
MKSICVYAGSNAGVHPAYEQEAIHLAKTIAEQGRTLVYGGSRIGLMGRLANTVLEHGGQVIGVMPRGLFKGEMVHQGLTELYEVESMHARKAKMMELSDGFIALPGGFGTFEELFEAVSWSQLGIHEKPIGLLDVEGFYAPLVAFVEQAVKAGFIHEAHAGLLLLDQQPAELIVRMESFVRPQKVNKWSELPATES